MDSSPDDTLSCYASGPDLPQQRNNGSRRPRREFIRGPLPVEWIGRAASLPGQALAVGLAIWFRAGLESSREEFRLYPSVLKRFSLNRWSAYRGLRALENAGLLRVHRHRGRSPLVTILKLPDE